MAVIKSHLRAHVGKPCPVCSRPMSRRGKTEVSRDHFIIPKIEGGDFDNIYNKLIMCKECNNLKRHLSLVEFQVWLRNQRQTFLTLTRIKNLDLLIERQNFLIEVGFIDNYKGKAK